MTVTAEDFNDDFMVPGRAVRVEPYWSRHTGPDAIQDILLGVSAYGIRLRRRTRHVYDGGRITFVTEAALFCPWTSVESVSPDPETVDW